MPPLFYHNDCATYFEVDETLAMSVCPNCGKDLNAQDFQAAAKPDPWLLLETEADARLCNRFGTSL